jgi:hypothetical protein
MLSNDLPYIGNEKRFVATNKTALGYTRDVAFNCEIDQFIWGRFSIFDIVGSVDDLSRKVSLTGNGK